MKKKIQILKICAYLAIAGIILILLTMLPFLKQYQSFILLPVLSFVALVIICHYFLCIGHCRKEYLGRFRARWFWLLVLEPVGIARLLYTRYQIKRFMDESYRYAYSPKTEKRRIGDLNVIVHQLDPAAKKKVRSQVMSITESPIYRYLVDENDEEFLKYHHGIIRRKRPRYKYPIGKFKDLIQDIKENGFRNEEPYIKVKGNNISDGQHRACVLHYLFGPDYELDVVLHKKFL
jgi:hypothetical protein